MPGTKRENVSQHSDTNLHQLSIIIKAQPFRHPSLHHIINGKYEFLSTVTREKVHDIGINVEQYTTQIT